MQVVENEFFVPAVSGHRGLLRHLSEAITERLGKHEYPMRVAVTQTTPAGYQCEVGVLEDDTRSIPYHDSIFHYQQRPYENTNAFNIVFLVPTGVGAAVGGHSGDAAPAARLLAGCCDTLILHPNVVNASDINELPDNALYVEGSVIARLMMGSIGLQRTRSNRVLVLLDKHEDPFFTEAAINSVHAARAAMGIDCPGIICMDRPIQMRTEYAGSGSAVGQVHCLERVCRVLHEARGDYDAVALSSIIQVPENYHSDYFQSEMVNPWGGVEAMLTHTISSLFNVPSAHSPMMSSREVLELDVGVVDPRKSAEAVSTTYLHCILKGLHRSPRIAANISMTQAGGLLTATDISCLVIPDRCVGLPTLAALEQGITVIAVRDSENCMRNDLEALPFRKGQLYFADNYLEAAGLAVALKAGVAVETVRRPIRFSPVSEPCSSPEGPSADEVCSTENENG